VGNAVHFGPDGIVFDTPITVSVPVYANIDLTSHELRIFRYHPQSELSPESWTEMKFPDGYQIPHDLTAIKCVTTSFSVYVAVKVPAGTIPTKSDAEDTATLITETTAHEPGSNLGKERFNSPPDALFLHFQSTSVLYLSLSLKDTNSCNGS